MNTDQKKQTMPPLGLSPISVLARPLKKEIHFPNRESAVKGFGILRRIEPVVEVAGNHTYRVSAKAALAELDKAGLKYEVREKP